MPTATDLVTDLPADFEVFGQAVATSMADLLGGTTGQILSKTSNTDMDFTWTTPNPGDITGVTAGVGISGGGTSGDVTVTNSMATAMTTSGDLIQATGSGTFARLATGTSGQYLTTNGTTNSWASVSAGANWSLFSTTTLTGALEITVTGISGKDKIMVLIERGSSANAASTIQLKLNSDSGANYFSTGYQITAFTTYVSYQFEAYDGGGNEILIGKMGSSASDYVSGYVSITGCNSSGRKMWQSVGGGGSSGVNQKFYNLGGHWNNSATVSSVTAQSTSGNFDGGTMRIYTSD